MRNNSAGEFDHLDIKSDQKIFRLFKDYAEILEQQNPNIQCENYLKEKVTKLQGILYALNERKSYVKSYVKKLEVRHNKQDKLNSV